MTTVTIADTPLLLPDYRVEHWQMNPDWEAAHLESMRANIREGMLVYDVGAEFGDFTALCALWAGTYSWHRPGAGQMTASNVVPVEPSAPYWPAIRETFELNGLPRPFGSFCGFASDETAYTESPRHPWPQAARPAYNGWQGFSNVKERPDLPRIRLDDLARATRRRPDAITIDVEGAEIAVILGAATILREHRPLLWVSVHPECLLRDWGVSAADFHATVKSFGYDAILLVDTHEEHWFYAPIEQDVTL